MLGALLGAVHAGHQRAGLALPACLLIGAFNWPKLLGMGRGAWAPLFQALAHEQRRALEVWQ